MSDNLYGVELVIPLLTQSMFYSRKNVYYKSMTLESFIMAGVSARVVEGSGGKI